MAWCNYERITCFHMCTRCKHNVQYSLSCDYIAQMYSEWVSTRAILFILFLHVFLVIQCLLLFFSISTCTFSSIYTKKIKKTILFCFVSLRSENSLVKILIKVRRRNITCLNFICILIFILSFGLVLLII